MMPGEQSMIVSSQHLAQSEGWQVSEYEYGLIVSYNAFSRWMTRCMSAVIGHSDFNPLDILVLHNVNHRGRAKRVADVAFVLNIEDQHTVNYALKKLVRSGLVEGERRGKERFYMTTDEGRRVCTAYAELRERCLLDTVRSLESDPDELRRIATVLRGLSGFYDQAARAASST
ncbi:winged helix DNA-binding protein [Roseovarius sp. S4756]|uniref:winged helix DNA-binding protein n=1 Tax=Roseovarius maritimus TaxID=3342637 RepID=UPI0037292262